MKTLVNTALLKARTFDSGALGLLSMVVHQFSAVGHYQITILGGGRAVAELGFDVVEGSTVMQLDIDLAQAARRLHSRPTDCDCHEVKDDPQVVSPRGYVLFHASAGSGYAAMVATTGGRTVFDSRELQAGDLFAVSLLEPADYSVANTLGTATGAILVTLKPEAAKRISELETLSVDVTKSGLEPGRIEATSSQGLVFRIKETARVVIEKKDKKVPVREKPAIHWQGKVPIPKKKKD